MRTLSLSLGSIGFSLILATACGGSQPAAESPAEPSANAPAAEAAPAGEAPAAAAEPAAAAAEPKSVEVSLKAKSGSKLSGKAVLTEASDGVKVVLSVEGIAPGDHGAHVHEKGDCSAEDGSSAGGHFNPGGHQHALPASTPRHLGDFGNITVGKDGKGTLELVATGANLKDGDPNSFLGRSIIIHEKKDDGGQPTGNAGGRIGCGEIK
jgi:superoxide dismutase, Cu-Zn family